MKVTLKNVKIHKDMSRETDCFSATIYLDGRLVGAVRNEGSGGPNFYDWNDHDAGRRIAAWAKERDPSVQYEHTDLVIAELLDEYSANQQLLRWCRKATCFRLAGDAAGNWRTVKAPYSPAVKRFLVDKYGDKIERIANETL